MITITTVVSKIKQETRKYCQSFTNNCPKLSPHKFIKKKHLQHFFVFFAEFRTGISSFAKGTFIGKAESLWEISEGAPRPRPGECGLHLVRPLSTGFLTVRMMH